MRHRSSINEHAVDPNKILFGNLAIEILTGLSRPRQKANVWISERVYSQQIRVVRVIEKGCLWIGESLVLLNVSLTRLPKRIPLILFILWRLNPLCSDI